MRLRPKIRTRPETAPAIASELIRAGAEVNAPGQIQQGETPLHQAVSNNNVEVAEVLLKAGADPEITGRFDGTLDTALGYALFFGLNDHLPTFRLNCPELLIGHGAKVYLPFAAALNDLHNVRKFFFPDHSLHPAAGLAPSEITLQQAFLFACRHGHYQICEYLLYRGAKVNAALDFFQYQKVTGLHLACEKGLNPDLIRLLLRNGADLKARDEVYQASPAGWAMFFGQDQAFDLLHGRK